MVRSEEGGLLIFELEVFVSTVGDQPVTGLTALDFLLLGPEIPLTHLYLSEELLSLLQFLSYRPSKEVKSYLFAFSEVRAFERPVSFCKTHGR